MTEKTITRGSKTITYTYDESITVDKTNRYVESYGKINDYENFVFTAYEDEKLSNYYDGMFTNWDSYDVPNGPIDKNLNSVSIGNSETLFGNSIVLCKINDVVHPVKDLPIQDLWWRPSVSSSTVTVENVTYTFYKVQSTHDSSWGDYNTVFLGNSTSVVDELHVVLTTPDSLGYVWTKTCYDAYNYVSTWGRSIEQNNFYIYYTPSKSMYLPAFEGVELPMQNYFTKLVYYNENDYLVYASGSKLNYANVEVHSYITSEEQMKLWLARFGLKFEYDGVMYKPIVEGGYITGYTSDMTEKSEWDDWTSTSDHTVPGGRPDHSGGIDKDDINNFPLDDAGGVCRFYALDTYDLSELNSSIYTEKDTGVVLNPGDFIVGLWLLPIDLSQFCSGIETIKLGTHPINASGSRMTTTRKVIDMGTMNVNQHFNGTFLDFAPYTEVSVYVPYCGMVHLPTALCMNKASNSINVKLVIDAISGACKGIISINGTVYTSINGSMMSSIPISAEQCATKAQTTISACVNALSGIIGATSYSATASSGNTDIFNKGAMTASLHTSGMSTQQGYNINPIGAGVNAISSIGNSMITYNNIAPDYIAGSTDSSVNYYMPQYCKLFISYPKVDMGDIAHTHGKVCNYQDTLGNCSGFTVVSRPHLNITCTNEERDEIKSLLESGVIL